jgi:hypothetical protein
MEKKSCDCLTKFLTSRTPTTAAVCCAFPFFFIHSFSQKVLDGLVSRQRRFVREGTLKKVVVVNKGWVG